MAIRIDRDDSTADVVVLRVAAPASGRSFEIDLLDSHDMEQALGAINPDETRHLVVDLAGASHVHSQAFWALVRIGEALSARGGQLILTSLSPYVERLVDLTTASASLSTARDVFIALTRLRGEKKEKAPSDATGQ